MQCHKSNGATSVTLGNPETWSALTSTHCDDTSLSGFAHSRATTVGTCDTLVNESVYHTVSTVSPKKMYTRALARVYIY